MGVFWLIFLQYTSGRLLQLGPKYATVSGLLNLYYRNTQYIGICPVEYLIGETKSGKSD